MRPVPVKSLWLLLKSLLNAGYPVSLQRRRGVIIWWREPRGEAQSGSMPKTRPERTTTLFGLSVRRPVHSISLRPARYNYLSRSPEKHPYPYRTSTRVLINHSSTPGSTVYHRAAQRRSVAGLGFEGRLKTGQEGGGREGKGGFARHEMKAIDHCQRVVCLPAPLPVGFFHWWAGLGHCWGHS